MNQILTTYVTVCPFCGVVFNLFGWDAYRWMAHVGGHEK